MHMPQALMLCNVACCYSNFIIQESIPRAQINRTLNRFLLSINLLGTNSLKPTSVKTVCKYSNQFITKFKNKIYKMNKQFDYIPGRNDQNNRKKTTRDNITEGALGASTIRWPLGSTNYSRRDPQLVVPNVSSSYELLGPRLPIDGRLATRDSADGERSVP